MFAIANILYRITTFFKRIWQIRVQNVHLPTHQLKSTKISAFWGFNRYTANFRKYFESKWKCKCLILSSLTIWLVPRLFARLEKFSIECITPLDINEFLFVRYIFQLCCKVTHFSRKTCRMRYLFYNSSQRMEYDSNSLRGICSSVAVLRQSLMATRTSSIISFASCCSSM